MSLYIALILIGCLYLIMLIWGHCMDRRDLMRRGVIPLPDNQLEDKYLYEITFFTGPDSEATTESNIYFLISGSYLETDPRRLPAATMNLYRRFDVNSFVMSTSGPLGRIRYLRVMHDSSGEPPYDTWELERVVIRDLQTKKKIVFETNCWLAFNRGDGRTDRIFNANIEENTFTENMYENTHKTINQDNVWIAMFMRAAGSRYSRKERVTICFVFLYISMLASAVWNNIHPETPRNGYYDVGPFFISAEVLLSGGCVILICFPVVYLLSFIFKRARPKDLYKNRAIHSFQGQRTERLEDQGLSRDEAKERAKVNIDSEKRAKQKDKRKKRVSLPFWTRYIAWLVSLVLIGVSIFFVWSYGIMWGEIKTVKWLSSFLIAFLISVIVFQWLKVLVYSILSSCFKTDLSLEDIDEDEELPALKQDEEWIMMNAKGKKPKRIALKLEGVDPDKYRVNNMSTKLTKERDIGFVLRGIFVYCIFLVIVLIISYERTDYNGYLLQKHLTDTFIKKGNLTLDFSDKIKTSDDWWYWAQNVILQEVRADFWYNENPPTPPLGLRGFMDDRANRMMGYAIIRQIRSMRNNCFAPYPMDFTIKTCSGTRGLSVEETGDFCAGWTKNETFDKACKWPEFKYQTSAQLQTFPYVAKLGTYSGGGYVLRLNKGKSELLNRMKQLQKTHWIDKSTRAVILEFSVFNANVNLFTTCTVIGEFVEGGGMVPKWRFEPIKLLRNTDFFGYVLYTCEVLFVVFIAISTIKELWQIKVQKCSYFSNYWNIAELCIITVSYTAFGMYIYRIFLTQAAVKVFNANRGNDYVRFDSAAYVDQYYVYFLSLIVFFSIIKLIKLLQFNNRMNVLALTIKTCWDELKVFFIAFGIVFFAFSCLFYFMFSAALEDFAIIVKAIQTSFKMMMGKFDFEAMNQANPLSPLLFFVFSVMNSMILINIMLTIIIQAFNMVKAELEKTKNKYDVIDHVWTSFHRFVRKENMPRTHYDPVFKVTKRDDSDTDEECEANSSTLPGKVDKLVEYINHTYFEGKMDMSDFEKKMKGGFQGHGRRVVLSSD